MTIRSTLIIGFICLLATCLAGGCTAHRGPEVVTIAPDQYQEAFTTAVALVRAKGWEPEIMDRRSGVIETGPVQAGSFFEPWHLNTEDMSTIAESTLSKTRTRVRIEFRPVNHSRLTQSGRSDVEPPDFIGVEDMPDLTGTATPLDLRAWVFVEHGHRPNIMRSTWDPGLKSTPRRTGYDRTWEQPPSGSFWIPTSRDRSAERKLLGNIERALQTNQPIQSEPEQPAS